MIITLIALALLIFCITIEIIDSNTYVPYEISGIAWAFSFVGLLATIICMTVILCTHAGTEAQIAHNNIQYESLQHRQEIIKSDYEDFSKSDVIRDIAEWNQTVVSAQYWSKNPWTSWFYNQKVVNNLKQIKIEEE